MAFSSDSLLTKKELKLARADTAAAAALADVDDSELEKTLKQFFTDSDEDQDDDDQDVDRLSEHRQINTKENGSVRHHLHKKKQKADMGRYSMGMTEFHERQHSGSRVSNDDDDDDDDDDVDQEEEVLCATRTSHGMRHEIYARPRSAFSTAEWELQQPMVVGRAVSHSSKSGFVYILVAPPSPYQFSEDLQLFRELAQAESEARTADLERLKERLRQLECKRECFVYDELVQQWGRIRENAQRIEELRELHSGLAAKQEKTDETVANLEARLAASREAAIPPDMRWRLQRRHYHHRMRSQVRREQLQGRIARLDQRLAHLEANCKLDASRKHLRLERLRTQRARLEAKLAALAPVAEDEAQPALDQQACAATQPRAFKEHEASRSADGSDDQSVPVFDAAAWRGRMWAARRQRHRASARSSPHQSSSHDHHASHATNASPHRRHHRLAESAPAVGAGVVRPADAHRSFEGVPARYGFGYRFRGRFRGV